MDENSFIPGLPNDLIHSKILSEIGWGDFTAASSVSKLWRSTLSENRLLLAFPPVTELPREISSKLELGTRSSHGILLLGHRVVIAGGQTEDLIAMDEVHIFDLERSRWESLPSLNTPLSSCFMGILVSAPSGNKIVALGGVRSDARSFWIESAQTLGYGDHEWAQVEPQLIPKLLESFRYVDSTAINLQMLTIDSGGLAKTLIA